MGDPLSCARCYRKYPFIKIVWCRQTTIVGGLYLCLTCHRILHGRRCKSYKDPGSSKFALVCCICRERKSELACPLCTTKEEDKVVTATMCNECSSEHHVDHKEIHLDHVFKLPLE